MNVDLGMAHTSTGNYILKNGIIKDNIRRTTKDVKLIENRKINIKLQAKI